MVLGRVYPTGGCVMVARTVQMDLTRELIVYRRGMVRIVLRWSKGGFHARMGLVVSRLGMCAIMSNNVGMVVTRETAGKQELKRAAKPQSSNASQEATACLLNELVTVSMIVWMAAMRLSFANLSALQVTRVDQTKLVSQPLKVLLADASKACL